jgi:hypothetical protein
MPPPSFDVLTCFPRHSTLRSPSTRKQVGALPATLPRPCIPFTHLAQKKRHPTLTMPSRRRIWLSASRSAPKRTRCGCRSAKLLTRCRRTEAWRRKKRRRWHALDLRPRLSPHAWTSASLLSIKRYQAAPASSCRFVTQPAAQRCEARGAQVSARDETGAPSPCLLLRPILALPLTLCPQANAIKPSLLAVKKALLQV